MIQKILFFLLFFIILEKISYSQEQLVYKTIEGDVALSGAYKGQQIIFASTGLFARINYQTAEIVLTLDPSTFRSTSTDTIYNQFAGLSVGIATLKGKMNIPYVNTLKHPDHKLKFEAELQINGIVKPIIVTGLLKHISSSGTYSCMLTLNFMIGLKDFKITPPEGYSNQAYLSVSQTVLKPYNQ